MSTHGFAFPPPPPPPPQRIYDTNTQAPRGRGYGGGSFRGRGAPRGSGFYQGNFGGGRGRGSGYASHGAPIHTGNRSATTFELNPSSKRTYTGQPRPRAPPAVPSFNANIENLLPPRPPLKHAEPKPPLPKKTNFLGLTPANADDSDSEDDIGEESRLLSVASPGDLQFEYRGHTSALRTPAEIVAWIAERRKRWPTQERRHAARKEAEEKKRRWEEEKMKKAEAIQAAKKKRAEDSQTTLVQKSSQRPQAQSLSVPAAGPDAHREAQARAEHLRRKALRAQKKLEAAESELLKATTETLTEDNVARSTLEGTSDDSDDLSDSSDLTDSTSSSGSDADSESGPEESSSKVEVEKIASTLRKPPRTKKPCLFFAKHGTCKYGAKCKYSHDANQGSSRQSHIAATGYKTGRKGLWQVMVEREEEEERKKTLNAIIALGKQGVLDEPL